MEHDSDIKLAVKKQGTIIKIGNNEASIFLQSEKYGERDRNSALDH